MSRISIKALVQLRFDLTDPDFTVEVLRLAPNCPVLCYSVLALSSFHHSKAAVQNGEEAERFHEKAVALLTDLMRNPTRLADGSGLASVVILRLYEESKGVRSFPGYFLYITMSTLTPLGTITGN